MIRGHSAFTSIRPKMAPKLPTASQIVCERNCYATWASPISSNHHNKPAEPRPANVPLGVIWRREFSFALGAAGSLAFTGTRRGWSLGTCGFRRVPQSASTIPQNDLRKHPRDMLRDRGRQIQNSQLRNTFPHFAPSARPPRNRQPSPPPLAQY